MFVKPRYLFNFLTKQILYLIL